MEKLGIYNPSTNPATIELNIDNSVKWLQNGAQPTDTARAILSYKGVMLKHHLLGGVRKGALTEEQVEEKFNAWLDEKQNLIQAKKDGLNKEEAEARAKALEAEKEANAKRIAAAAPLEEEVADQAIEEAAAEPAPEAETAPEAEASPEAETAPEDEVPAAEKADEAPATEEAPKKED